MLTLSSGETMPTGLLWCEGPAHGWIDRSYCTACEGLSVLLRLRTIFCTGNFHLSSRLCTVYFPLWVFESLRENLSCVMLLLWRDGPVLSVDHSKVEIRSSVLFWFPQSHYLRGTWVESSVRCNPQWGDNTLRLQVIMPFCHAWPILAPTPSSWLPLNSLHAKAGYLSVYVPWLIYCWFMCELKLALLLHL